MCKRICGFVSRIDRRKALNTSASFRFEITGPLNYSAEDQHGTPGNFSRICFLLCAYSSYFLLTGPQPVMIGDAATGGGERAQLDFWAPASMVDWGICSPDTMFADRFGDFDDWETDRAPFALAGAPFALDEPSANPMPGVRIPHRPAPTPGLAHCQFIRERRDRGKSDDVESVRDLNCDH